MWIDRREYREALARAESLMNQFRHDYNEQRCKNHELMGENVQLKVRLQQQETLNEWFRHRLTQVEQERAQLIYAATGGKEPIPREVKIPAPNFNGQVPVENFATMAQMLNKGFNPFEGIGEDSQDPNEQLPEHIEDTSNMPTRR